MQPISDILEHAVSTVLGAPALVRPADPRFGDYQANGVLAAAKTRKQNPRELAQTILDQLDVSEFCESPTIAGPGFINFVLKPSWVATRTQQAASDPRLGVDQAPQPQTVVIDFSSPNVAKPMHVGHIRSTIIGDCLARVLRFLGHKVITDNHLGDWGTQFGMLILGWKHHRDNAALAADPIAELERLYRYVNEHGDREQARQELAKLQQGDTENRSIWQTIIDLSRQEFDAMYARLGVRFDHTLGESFYHPRLSAVIDDLTQHGIAVESEGAMCVFFTDDPQLKKSAPLIVRKGDGAFLYGTTDLATLQYRIGEWHPDTVIYITDARQILHFQQVFKTATRWLPTLPELRHVTFGSILGEDNKPLKTREGTPIKLAALLDEAEQRALTVVTEKNPALSQTDHLAIARAVGIGAIKYADLSQNRTTDYVFSWDKMLAMNGNTAPYMQYAYVRVQSIFRKAAAEVPVDQQAPLAGTTMTFSHPSELDLAKHLLRFGEVLEAVAADDRPNWLTTYLYELAGKFSAFYDSCPVLKADEASRACRLMLCRLTADIIKHGLDLLGIDVIEQM